MSVEMNISVITPSVRKEGLDIVAECLRKQTFDEWEWLVCSPFKPPQPALWIPEPKKRPGDYYNLNKAWNAMFKHSVGYLIVSIVDLLWFPPDTLERLWNHFLNSPKTCVGAIGHQYKEIIDGKPEGIVWQDPRARTDQGSFWEIKPIDLELCVASLPRKGVLEVGGVDPEWDKYCALSEKEMLIRMDKLGYRFYIDATIEYRALKHPRLGGSKAWDEGYKKGSLYFQQCIKEIREGKRLKVEGVK